MDKISVLACGDFVADNPSLVRISEEFQNKLNGSDLNICNFEAPISGEWKALPKSGPSLAQSPDSPGVLEKMGFNVVLMANNHIMDYGVDAFKATISSFRNSLVVGAGKASEAYSCKIVTVKGKKIGLLAFCQYEFGIIESKSDSGKTGVAWVNSLDIPNLLKNAKEKCDFVLVFPHAGLEDIDAPLPIWKQNYRKLVEWGADAVIASHPHVPQGWEVYQGKPIFYSLGNFYFDVLGGNDYWNKGLIVELILGETIDFKVYNTIFSKDGIIKFDYSDEIIQHNEELLALLLDDKKYSGYIDEECQRRYRVYTYSILRGLGGIAWSNLSLKMIIRLIILSFINNKDKETLMNTLRCETHRWVYERCLIISNNNGK